MSVVMSWKLLAKGALRFKGTETLWARPEWETEFIIGVFKFGQKSTATSSGSAVFLEFSWEIRSNNLQINSLQRS